MIEILLALPLAAPCLLSPLPQDGPILDAEEVSAPAVHVVFHDGDELLRSALIHSQEVWHDAGEFLVGVFDARTIEGLAERGVESQYVGAVDSEQELWLISDREVGRLGGKLSPLCEELVHVGTTRLLSIPAGTYPKGAGVSNQGGLHIGMMRIPQRALLPVAPFSWRGQTPPGPALSLNGHDPRLQALVDQVDANNLLATVSNLSSIFSRRANLSGCDTARNRIKGWFESFGLTTRYESFSSTYSENVIAELPGTLYPDEIIIVGGHYDSINLNGSSYAAPGADDNASGTACVVEVARILAAHGPLERTVRFIAFGGEELGLYGSARSASNSRTNHEDIVAMLNTDMNAYLAPGDTRSCDFITNNSDYNLINFCQAAGALYVPNYVSRQGVLGGGSSDHASYYAEGYSAVFFFEDTGQYSPYIHTTSDTVGTSANDWTLAEMICQNVLAAAVSKAEFVDMAIAHTPVAATTDAWGPYLVNAQVTSLNGGTPIGVDVYWSCDGGDTWSSTAMSDLGGGNWQGALPSCGSPVTIHYYLAATDDQGGAEVLPEGANLGGDTFSFFVGLQSVLYATGFEGGSAGGWTHGMDLREDDWQRGDPTSEAGDPGNAYEGSYVWGNDIGTSSWDGEYRKSIKNWLRSPVIDCSTAQTVHLEFQRWLTIERYYWDKALILVNGTEVWRNSDQEHTLDTSWHEMSIDISPWAAGVASVQIEFRLETDTILEFGGWNIDDLVVRQGSATPGNVLIFGGGVNPAGSMVHVSGTASIGGSVVMGVDNPLGTQATGSPTFLFISLSPDANYPAGTLLPGWGMTAGGNGEILINALAPDPYLMLAGPSWNGAGQPAPITVGLPDDPTLVGFQVYGQGAIIDPAATFGVKIGVTEGFVFQIGG